MRHDFVYQQPGWPSFDYDGRLVANRLPALRHQQGRLLERMQSLGFASQEETTLENLTEEIVASSAIEGDQLDQRQVRSSVARRLGLDMGGLAPVDRNVEAAVEMMLDATRNFREPLTDERLFGWHAALFPNGRSGMHKITVGGWRTDAGGPMQVVSGTPGRERVHFQAPAATDVAAEMRAFLRWFNASDDLDLVMKAGIAHFWFVTIHPFDDGNGRIARAITDMLLAGSEDTSQRFYSMSAQIQIERADYYRILEATQRGDRDITAWLAWFFDCLGRAFERAKGAVRIETDKAKFWEHHREFDFNERQRKVINRLFDGFEGKLTSSKWAAMTNASPDTALRDIEKLIDAGILLKDAAGGRSTSYSLVTRAGTVLPAPPL
jgi:Fic family protein